MNTNSTEDDDDDDDDAKGSLRGMMTRSYSRKGISTPEEPERDRLVKTFISEGLQLVVKAAAGQLEGKQHSLHRPAFELFCQAHVKAYAEYKQYLLNKQLEKQLENQLEKQLEQEKISHSGDSEHPSGVINNDMQPAVPLPGEKQPATPLPGVANTSDSIFVTNPNPSNTSTTVDPPTTAATTTGIDPTTTTTSIVQPPTTTATTTTNISSSKVDLPYFNVASSAFNLDPALQEQLQIAIDSTNLPLLLQSISEGALIQTEHLRQVGIHVGDQYIPLFVTLLYNSLLYYTERLHYRDNDRVINAIANPINAFTYGLQVSLFITVFIYLSIYPSIYLSIHL